MGNRPKGYWIVFLVAVAAVIAGLVMMRSPDAHTRDLGRYFGYGAIVLLLIARFALPRRTTPEPPMPKD